MSTGFSNEFKELVRSRTNLVELVSESITLQSRGRDFIGLCPFHDDHSPSMTISPERQSYKCWVCDEGGDCFSWVMKYDSLGFYETLQMLATRANLEMPAHSGRGSSPNQQSKQPLLDALEWAENEFHQFLISSPDAETARNYLNDRGFSPEIIAEYRVGYHPNNWEWLLNRAGNRFAPAVLQAARLVAERRDGSGYRDEFVDRVMFPIHDDRGRAVAFGGRILPGNDRENVAKYWNSPESPVFIKSRLLYGLDVARKDIRAEKTALVVEGYTDCMMIRQHGIGFVVATLGTALGESHVQLLRRFAERVVLVYDGDAPGQRAAERAVAQFLSQEVDLRVLTLPTGQDPADYLLEQGGDAFRTLIQSAPEAWEYKLQILQSRHSLDTVDGRQRLLNEMVELLAIAPRLSGTVREDILLAKLSRKVGLPERKLRQIVAKARRSPTNRHRNRSANKSMQVPVMEQETAADGSPPWEEYQTRAPHTNELQSEPHATEFYSTDLHSTGSHHTASPAGNERLERELLEMIFAAPEIVEHVSQEITAHDFGHRNLRTLLQLCFDIAETGERPTYERITAVLEDPALKQLAVQIDELAAKKQLSQKLQPDKSHLGFALSLLDEVIDRLKWNRQSNRRVETVQQPTNQPTDQTMDQATDPMMDQTAVSSEPPTLGADAKERLRQMTEQRQTDPTMKLRFETERNH